MEDEASDEEAFFDWSSSPPSPKRREVEEAEIKSLQPDDEQYDSEIKLPHSATWPQKK